MFIRRINKHARELRDKFISGRAVSGPVRRHVFAALQYFFYQYVKRLRRSHCFRLIFVNRQQLHIFEIFIRIPKPVNMIDA